MPTCLQIDSCGQTSSLRIQRGFLGGPTVNGKLKRQNVVICKLPKGCANMPSNRLVWTKQVLRIQRGFLGGPMSVNGGLWQTEATKRCDLPKMVVPTCLQTDSCGQSRSLRIQRVRGFLGGPMSVNGGLWQTEATKRCDMQIAQRLCHSCGQNRSFRIRSPRGFNGKSRKINQ